MRFRLDSGRRGGGERDRTDDLLLAKQALSQLSYTPGSAPSPSVVGLVGLEPTTPALSRRCSNQLSYRPSAYSSSGSGAARRHLKNDTSPPCATRCRKKPTDKCGRLNRSAISRKEVIQPHLPVRLPCYDFTPVMKLTVVAALLAVRQTASGGPHSHGVTGGVYKTRERIHRDMLIRDY
jgi:hypothetical protein